MKVRYVWLIAPLLRLCPDRMEDEVETQEYPMLACSRQQGLARRAQQTQLVKAMFG
jgi:hypothetical protein